MGTYQAGLRRDGAWDWRRRCSPAPLVAVQESYSEIVTDEFIKPIVVVDADGSAIGPVRDGDSIVFFNFRADRARQLTRALALDDFDGFDRPNRPHVHCTTMTVYDRTFALPVVFDPQTFSGNLADVLAAHGRTNLRLAETEKYAHVTYFFNCGREQPYPREDRVLVPSQKVATYDLMPEMSAPGITAELVGDLTRNQHDVVICNFANADMVGHTGRLDATIAAVETLDTCLGHIMTAVASQWRHGHRDRRSRQCRTDVGQRIERPAHGPHIQSRAGDSVR